MKIVSARLFAVQIPLRHAFNHSLAVRRRTESIVVQLIADTGETGFGEGAPRAYVTGETASSCLARIESVFLPEVFRHELRDFSGYAEPSALLAKIHSLLPAEGNNGVIACHAAKCAVELALLDVVLRHAGTSFRSLLPPCSESLVYSAVISADDVKTVRAITTECVRREMKYFKVKIGQGDDYERVAAVREVAGDTASLRVDANGAFSAAEALDCIHKLHPFRIESIEQPVKRGDIRALAYVKKNSPIPVMVDESLVTECDAAELIEHDACDIFNLRISKNGGVYQTLRLASMAHEAGLDIQVGCQAGETAILSAAGRHLAAHIHDVTFLEGSYGNLLLEEDISREPVEFGRGGFAPLLKGPGLGVAVLEESLKKYAVKTIEVSGNQI